MDTSIGYKPKWKYRAASIIHPEDSIDDFAHTSNIYRTTHNTPRRGRTGNRVEVYIREAYRKYFNWASPARLAGRQQLARLDAYPILFHNSVWQKY